MKSPRVSLLSVGAIALILLSACQQTSTTNPATTANKTPAPSLATKANKSSQPQKGGQVVESGPYHLELTTLSESGGTHLDLYLQTGDNHKAIPNAQVTAQVQLPDGSEKTLNLPYDTAGEHYAVLLPSKTTGRYLVKIAADIKGKKAIGRFTFNR